MSNSEVSPAPVAVVTGANSGLGQKLPGPVDRPDRAGDRVAVFGEVEGRSPTDAAVDSGDDGNSGGGDFGVRHACNLGDI